MFINVLLPQEFILLANVYKFNKFTVMIYLLMLYMLNVLYCDDNFICCLLSLLF